ncbi:MAG: cysteine synthase A [Bacillota bacterium]|nr:cysteine synthase A [Bacillota bacterium]
MLASSLTDLIGRTPLVQISTHIYAKVEALNPAASIKDRVALAMIDAAERDGRLGPGATIIEPTSGNTGIGLAAISAARGYRCILVMPDTMSVERQRLMKIYDAKVELTPGRLGMAGAIARAEELAAATGGFIPDQFRNPANPAVHERTTGPEIWADSGGQVDVLVAGVGTGGTLTGVGRYLRSQNPDLYIVAVEPADSAVLSGGAPGPHPLQGIGAGFVPEVLDTSLIDRVVAVTGPQAIAAARRLARQQGLLVGISSGAAAHAAFLLAADPAHAGQNIVVILPDSGERYLSTELFAAP